MPPNAQFGLNQVVVQPMSDPGVMQPQPVVQPNTVVSTQMPIQQHDLPGNVLYTKPGLNQQQIPSVQNPQVVTTVDYTKPVSFQYFSNDPHKI